MSAFQDRLEDLQSNLELVGSMWEVFSELDLASQDKAKEEALNSFGSFFVTSMEACLVATCVGLYRLHDKRGDVLSIQRIGKEAQAEPLAKTSAPPDVSALLAEADPILEKIKTLRHKVFAHRDHQLSTDDVFKAADLKPTQIAELIEVTRQILNKYSVWFHKVAWSPSDHAGGATRNLVNGLLRLP